MILGDLCIFVRNKIIMCSLGSVCASNNSFDRQSRIADENFLIVEEWWQIIVKFGLYQLSYAYFFPLWLKLNGTFLPILFDSFDVRIDISCTSDIIVKICGGRLYAYTGTTYQVLEYNVVSISVDSSPSHVEFAETSQRRLTAPLHIPSCFGPLRRYWSTAW